MPELLRPEARQGWFALVPEPPGPLLPAVSRRLHRETGGKVLAWRTTKSDCLVLITSRGSCGEHRPQTFLGDQICCLWDGRGLG